MTAILPPYDILELSPGAGRAEIDLAYRRLIKQHHPDHVGGDGARAAEINRAYALLKSSSIQFRFVESGDAEDSAAPWADSSGAAAGPRSGTRLRSAGWATLLLALLVGLFADDRARVLFDQHWLDQQWQRLKGDFAHARGEVAVP